MYALEGSIAVTGSAVQWLRDQLGIIAHAAEVEALAAPVDGHRRRVFVPAFSGLFAPYWRTDARGRSSACPASTPGPTWRARRSKPSVTRRRDVLEAMATDSGVRLDVLKVDGGVTVNELCMQLQADILGVEVSKPVCRDHRAGCRLRRRPGGRFLGRRR